MVSRRFFLASVAVSTASFGLKSPALAQFGYLNAVEEGISPNTGEDISAQFEALLWRAGETNQNVFLPAGEYIISHVKMPSNMSIMGARGHTRLIARANAPIITCDGCINIGLENISFVGTGDRQAHGSFGLVDFANCKRLKITNCDFSKSAKNGISLYASAGHISDCVISDVEEAGIKSVDAAGLVITANHVRNCGNNGILVWRNEPGHDGTIVSQNRISDIDWRQGGNGQNGNGINVFRAGDVVVSNNVITECAFSAVRANASINCQIIGNNCRNLYEVAIFSEFEFSGSLVAHNIIDGAAQGISITNWNNGGHLAVCAQNIVRNIFSKSPNNPDTIPLAIGVEADVAVDGNVIENVPGFAIGAGWGPYLRNISITDNVVRGAKYGIYVSVVDGVGPVQIKDNLLTNIEIDAFVAGEWDRFVDNQLQENTKRYKLIDMSGNMVN